MRSPGDRDRIDLPGPGYAHVMGSLTYGLIVTVLAMVAVAVFILLFERKRAREIQNDPQRSLPQQGPRHRAS